MGDIVSWGSGLLIPLGQCSQGGGMTQLAAVGDHQVPFQRHSGQIAFGSLSSCSWVLKFCLGVCGACVSVLRFGVLAAESFRGTWSVFVCPLTGQCPHGLSRLPSLSLCKYWMAASGGVATEILSSCWGWVAEGNPTCRLWQWTSVYSGHWVRNSLFCIPVFLHVCVCGLGRDFLRVHGAEMRYS